MNILILGGTVFLGRHLVEAALARGHTPTIFTRGQHNPELFPQIERLRGDRNGDLEALRGRQWDAVIDTSGYLPRIVRASAELLADAVEHYTFISSISVYSDNSVIGMDESGPLGTLEDPTIEQITGESYGPLKALCEQAVEQVLPGRTLIIRPGLIVGPHDPTDRFTYWPVRVARGGAVLAPEHPSYRIQFIDVRDLAGWIITMVERRATGVFNATGPERELGLGELLEVCREVAGSTAEIVWADQAFLATQNVQPWSELPLWVPESPETRGFSAFDCSRAIAAGLRFRPLAETVRDTLAWAQRRPRDHEWRAGLSAEREAELLAQQ